MSVSDFDYGKSEPYRGEQKVSVGEPAEGSFAKICSIPPPRTIQCFLFYHQKFNFNSSMLHLIAMYAILSIKDATTNALARGSLKAAANWLNISGADFRKVLNAFCELTCFAHVIDGDRNMQSLELRSSSGVPYLSQVLRRVFVGQASLVFELHYEFISLCSISLMSRFSFLKTFFPTLTISRDCREFKHINKRRTSNRDSLMANERGRLKSKTVFTDTECDLVCILLLLRRWLFGQHIITGENPICRPYGRVRCVSRVAHPGTGA